MIFIRYTWVELSKFGKAFFVYQNFDNVVVYLLKFFLIVYLHVRKAKNVFKIIIGY